MPDEEGTRRWQRTEPVSLQSDVIGIIRSAIAAVRKAPADLEVRRHLRAIAIAQNMTEQVALLLLDEARAHAERPAIALAFWEELADAQENLDQPLEVIAAMERVVAIVPDDVDRLDRLAWLYRTAGAWSKAAEMFERVGLASNDERARAALRAAGKLYRDNGRLDRAVLIYRAIVERRPADVDAWRALETLLAELGKFEELSAVRGDRVQHASSEVEKATLLRSQARALEQAGDLAGAARVVKTAATHAPHDVSSLVDYADVLARGGQVREAADILRTRVSEAQQRGAQPNDVAALRLRLVSILEDAGDEQTAQGTLDELLGDAPEYVPALERVTAMAASDPDPRVHAAALLRYAAALPEHARTPYMVAAARRYREAGDHRGALRTFDQAAQLAPDDRELRAELEEVRTTAIVHQATADAETGDARGASERRLREILATQRHHVGANLALADILAGTQRLEAAAAHLRDALSGAPDTLAETDLAQLAFRLALIMNELGDSDEAHQLLHDAHRLDRRALPITLALGESCFARKLWRQAALHLGAAAEHRDAGRYAGAVATGLVHAAQAEIRALRPTNAAKHYETAVKIDPGCAPAWHALAEVAIERGDLATAADCLEREATATTVLDARIRLFDALGDMAVDVLADKARAERCWATAAGIPGVSAALLEKLVALQRERGATTERALTAERLAELAPDLARAKPLLEEAATAYAAGNDLERAMQIAEEIMQRHPRDAATVAAASGVAAKAGDAKRVVTWLRAALAKWESTGERGDPAIRATLWRRLGDAHRDLDDEPAALLAYQRAVAAHPSSEGALAARRGLVELAATTGRQQHSSLIALVEATQDPFDVLAFARSAARSEEPEDARAGYELARSLGAKLTADDEKFLAANLPRIMASDEGYAAALTTDDRAALIDADEPGTAAMAGILALLSEALPLLAPNANNALVEANLLDAKRLPAASESAVVAMYPAIVKLLGGPATLLYAAPRSRVDLQLLLASPAVVVVGARFTNMRAASRSEIDLSGDGILRFQLGRLVELSRPSRILATGQDAASFALFIAALRHAFVAPHPSTPRDVTSAAERLRAKLPVALRGKLAERLASLSATALDPHAYRASCDRAADRAGLLACGDIALAVELAGGPATAGHLVRMGANQRYLATRKRLRAK